MAASSKSSRPASEGLRFIGLNLAPGVSASNMLVFYWGCLMGILLAAFVPQMQPYLLTEFLSIPQAEHGMVSGKVNFWGEVVIVSLVGFWGAMSDRAGRRRIIAASFAIMAVGLVFYPYSGSYDQLLVARVIYCVGNAAYMCMITTLIADYVKDESRGRGNAYLGIANGIGAMITVFVLLRLPSVFQADGMSSQDAGIATYQIVAGVALLTALLMWFGLRKNEVSLHDGEMGVITIAKQGLLAARDPGIALAYGASFIARGNLMIVGTFFTLWIANYGTAVEGLSRADALARAGLIIGIAQSVTLIGAPVFGLLADRIDRVHALIVTLCIAAIGYGGTYFVENPMGKGMVVCAIFIGLAEVGCIITSNVLIAQQAPAKIRGAVIGFFNLSGTVGIMFASIIGGYLFDAWRPSGPFVFFGVLAVVVLIWALAVRNRITPLYE